MKNKLFIGIDVGGTKIAAGLIGSQGNIIDRVKKSTPAHTSASTIIDLICNLITKDLLKPHGIAFQKISGIGIGIPGIVDTEKGIVLVTPNMQLSGCALQKKLAKKIPVKLVIGNDVNLGVLGEKKFGAGINVKNLIGLFIGTGIGGGIIIEGKLHDFHAAGAELGHIIVETNGPLCGCGNRGCLEALASRRAIECDIRTQLKKGKKSIITKLTQDDLSKIKSRILAKALAAKDPVVTNAIKRAATYVGVGCISLRHIFNPEMIILGGGVTEACGDFMLPIIKKVVKKDPFFAHMPSCKIIPSTLGDDAVILGAVALAAEYHKKNN